METVDVEGTQPTLEADCVYVQMKKQYRVSRYIRAQWFVSQIGKTIQPKQTDGEICGEVQVLSVLPRVCPAGWRPGRAHEFAYQVTAATKVTFLAKKYRFVFCLDLSASVASVDIRSETLLFDDVFSTLSQCIKKLVMPFYVPGSRLLFQPEIYVTVIAYIPHYTPAVQQASYCLRFKFCLGVYSGFTDLTSVGNTYMLLCFYNLFVRARALYIWESSSYR